MKDRTAKLSLMRRNQSGNKRKVEVGSGSDSVSLAKVPRLEVAPASPQPSHVKSQPSSGSPKVAQTPHTSAEVERALEMVSHLLLGSLPRFPTEGQSSQLPQVCKSEKGKLPRAEAEMSFLIDNVKRAADAIASILPESDI